MDYRCLFLLASSTVVRMVNFLRASACAYQDVVF
jgi:hypothetical protein